MTMNLEMILAIADSQKGYSREKLIAEVLSSYGELDREPKQAFYTIADLAKRWHVSTRSITNWYLEGILPATRLNRTGKCPRSPVRFALQDVLEFEARGKKQRKGSNCDVAH